MDYKDEGIKLAVSTVEGMIVKFTPDDAISAVDALVHVAVDIEISGKDKAKWVLEQSVKLVEGVWQIFLPILIELMYKIMMGYAEDFRNAK